MDPPGSLKIPGMLVAQVRAPPWKPFADMEDGGEESLLFPDGRGAQRTRGL